MPIKTPGGNQLKLIDDQKDVVGQLFNKNLSLKDAISFAFSESKYDAALEIKKIQDSKSKDDEVTTEEIDKITELITSKLSERIAFAIDEYIKETIVTIKSNIQVHVDTEIDGRKYSGEGKTTSSGTS